MARVLVPGGRPAGGRPWWPRHVARRRNGGSAGRPRRHPVLARRTVRTDPSVPGSPSSRHANAPRTRWNTRRSVSTCGPRRPLARHGKDELGRCHRVDGVLSLRHAQRHGTIRRLEHTGQEVDVTGRAESVHARRAECKAHTAVDVLVGCRRLVPRGRPAPTRRRLRRWRRRPTGAGRPTAGGPPP